MNTGIRSKFFLWLAGVEALIVLTGFLPTFYLRGRIIPLPELSAHLILHGTVMTLWFILLPVQSWLVTSGRLKWHKQLGMLGMLLAVAVVVSTSVTGFYALNSVPAEFPWTAPIESRADLVAERSAHLFNTVGLISVFIVLVAVSFLQRHRPANHKRLLLIASAAMVGAPAFRWTFLMIGFGVAPELAFAIGGRAGLVMPLILIVAVALYDRLDAGRVLPVTLYSAGTAVVLHVAALQFSTSSMARDWVDGFVHIEF